MRLVQRDQGFDQEVLVLLLQGEREASGAGRGFAGGGGGGRVLRGSDGGIVCSECPGRTRKHR